MTLHNIKQLKRDNGFTIIELLIVIIVIGILATLVLVGYNNIQGQASATKRQADAGSIRDAAAAYKVASTSGVYPTNTAAAFGTDIGNGANYASGSNPINIDSTIVGKISPSTLPTSSTADTVYTVSYCGPASASAPTASTATGMKIFYWGSGALAAVTTGTNTGGNAVQSSSVAGCTVYSSGL